MRSPQFGRSGHALVYCAIAMVVLTGFASLGVDLGRAQLVKTELQRAADAAARYALQGLSNSTAVAKAQASAAENQADGSAVTLLSSDVEVGTWANGAFTVGGASPNAVRVWARRISSRGTAVPLLFGQVLGMSTCDIVASAVAYKPPTSPSPYAMVGVSSVTMSNGATSNSYSSSSGAYGGANITANGNVGSNGNVSLTGSSTKINGNADAGASGTVTTSSAATVTGSKTSLPYTLDYSDPTPPTSGTYWYLGSVSVSSGSSPVPGGTYMFDAVNVTGGNWQFLGPATVYVNGAFNFSGGVITTYQNKPGNLKIIQLSSNPMTIGSGVDLYADIYAPNSAINLSGVGTDLYGRIVGDSINANAAAVHFDTDLPAIGAIIGGGNGCIVK